MQTSDVPIDWRGTELRAPWRPNQGSIVLFSISVFVLDQSRRLVSLEDRGHGKISRAAVVKLGVMDWWH